MDTIRKLSAALESTVALLFLATFTAWSTLLLLDVLQCSYYKEFSYGRGAGERSLFYWLKASYFTLKFHPHRVGYLVTVHWDTPLKNLVALDNFEMSTYRLSSDCSSSELQGKLVPPYGIEPQFPGS